MTIEATALFHPLFSSLTTSGLNNQAITNPIKNGVATLRMVMTNFRIPHSFTNKVAMNIIPIIMAI